MKVVKNIRIGTRLVLGFVVLIVFTVVLSLVGIINLRNISQLGNSVVNANVEPSFILNSISTNSMRMTESVRDAVMFSKTPQIMSNYTALYDNSKQNITNALSGYEEMMKKLNIKDQSEIALFELLKNTAVNELFPASDTAMYYAKNQVESDDVGLYLKLNVHPIADRMSSILDYMYNLHSSNALTVSNDNLTVAGNIEKMMIVLVACAVVIAVFFAYIITKSITSPIKQLLVITGEVADGNLNVNIDTSARDEFGKLSGVFVKMIQTLHSLTQQMNLMADSQAAGNTGALIATESFKGEYRLIAEKINDLTKEQLSISNQIIECVTEIGRGNFSAELRKFPGDLHVLNDSVEVLRRNIKLVYDEISNMVTYAIEGKLDKRADLTGLEGDWKGLIAQLNKLVQSIATPVHEAMQVLEQMAEGNLNVSMQGVYSGDFSLIKDSLNHTSNEINSYIEEITNVLNEIANNNLTAEISREYIGDFASIKMSINLISDKLNQFMSEVNRSSVSVTDGSKMIAEGSMAIAENAATQSTSIQDLTLTVSHINEQTQKNADNAKRANDLSVVSKNNAYSGNTEMTKMLDSMKGIESASNNISKIIKVIDDIAFQTNLLALNAAVEAARAGIHGKGFAVVAEEVGSLAARSQKAAKETGVLIEDSLNRVTEGMNIANATAKALGTIVSNIGDISLRIDEITAASYEQSKSVSQLSIGLTSIAQVVQNNSAGAEESAASAQELSEQAENLNKLVSIFKLK